MGSAAPWEGQHAPCCCLLAQIAHRLVYGLLRPTPHQTIARDEDVRSSETAWFSCQSATWAQRPGLRLPLLSGLL